MGDRDADHHEIREAIRPRCADSPGQYWQEKNRACAYPDEFVRADRRRVAGRADPRGAWRRRPGLGAALAIIEEIHQAAAYPGERSVFGQPIGENQDVQFPIAHAHGQTSAAALMAARAAALFGAGEPCGTEASIAKLVGSEASWAAADICLQTQGGFGFAEEYDIARKFRETRLYQVARISTNLILSHVATHALGLPKSF